VLHEVATHNISLRGFTWRAEMPARAELSTVDLSIEAKPV